MRTNSLDLVLALAITALFSLAGPTYGSADSVHRPARVPVHANYTVHARSTAPATVSLHENLTVQSKMTLGKEHLRLIAWHFRNAARLAQDFATRRGIAIQRQVLPGRVELLDGPGGVAEATGKPRLERLGEAVARVDLRRGIVYLGRKTPEDLYVELGKWLFYEHTYRWGRNHCEDRRHLRIAEDFAKFCLDRKRWDEAGGSTGSIR